MYYCLCNCSTLAIKTVLCLLLYHAKFATCNLYNNILVKSTNQFLQCMMMITQQILFTVILLCTDVLSHFDRQFDNSTQSKVHKWFIKWICLLLSDWCPSHFTSNPLVGTYWIWYKY